MKIIKTALFLVIALLLILTSSYFFGVPLGAKEWDILEDIFKILVMVIGYCFFAGELTKNYSQVDKLWSIIPVVYTFIIAYHGAFTPRLIIMFALVLIWGMRLTYNFSRHGGYSIRFWEGKEDYRWTILRQKSEFDSKWVWILFNFLFISIYQNVLLLLIVIPTLIAYQNNEIPLNTFDYVAVFLMLFFIVMEAIADNQQWKFQSKKRKLINTQQELKGQYSKGFCNKGLWSYMRHPNYFAEQGIWVSYYLFSVAASGQSINWSIIGCLLLIILFKGSSDFSEEISASKYPEYKQYQKNVPRFVPFSKKIIR